MVSSSSHLQVPSSSKGALNGVHLAVATSSYVSDGDDIRYESTIVSTMPCQVQYDVDVSADVDVCSMFVV